MKRAAWLVAMVSLVAYSNFAVSAAYSVTVIARGFADPFAFVPLPDGDFLVTEKKTGHLLRWHAGRVMPPIDGVPESLTEGDYAGLQDVILHPAFSENHLIYFSFIYGTRDANAVRVARGRYDGHRLSDVRTIFTVSPTKDTLNHPGARLAFIRDGTLIITVGDGFQYREQAQDLGSQLGKIVRVTELGSIPRDNPFVLPGGGRSPIWAYGVRHPLGILYDSTSDRLYENENGPQGGDELNLVEKGQNYGWPLATYGIGYSGTYVSPYRQYSGTRQPLLYWTPSLAPSGMAQCRRCQWPEWEGDLFISMLAGQQVRRVSLRAGRSPQQEALFEDRHARMRDVRFGPDGALYVLQDDGVLFKATRH